MSLKQRISSTLPPGLLQLLSIERMKLKSPIRIQLLSDRNYLIHKADPQKNCLLSPSQGPTVIRLCALKTNNQWPMPNYQYKEPDQ